MKKLTLSIMSGIVAASVLGACTPANDDIDDPMNGYNVNDGYDFIDDNNVDRVNPMNRGTGRQPGMGTERGYDTGNRGFNDGTGGRVTDDDSPLNQNDAYDSGNRMNRGMRGQGQGQNRDHDPITNYEER
ncbi:MAG: hypothetical protein LRY73_04125 [Bacillus sp. (in: Bacteria)]|nr:hypothetical protein [Bacillus sp. (in: firmicutes)]